MSDASNDMVYRIKNRSARTTVPERNMSLAEISPSKTESINTTSSLSTNSELEGLPEVGSRRQIRLETLLDSEIEDFCKRNKITMETYFEALHLICKSNAGLVDEAVKEAKKRLLSRKKAGKIRRLQTQMKQGFTE